jgi:hypothetical protein
VASVCSSVAPTVPATGAERGEGAARPLLDGQALAPPLQPHAHGADDAPRGVAPAMEAPSAAQVAQPLAPVLAGAGAVAQEPDGGVQLGEDAQVQLATVSGGNVWR